MKNNYLYIFLLFSLCVIISSCKDEDYDVKIKSSDNPHDNQLINKEFEVAELDGQKLEWITPVTNKKQNSLSKGIIATETILDTKTARLLSDPLTTYTVIRVDRFSQPGKYFYVMIDNLDIPIDTACWAYDDNELNAIDHGRLYTYNSAVALSSRVVVDLPVVINGVERGVFPTPGRLPNMTDICDIIQCSSIGSTPESGYDLNQELDNNVYNYYFNFYYDAFVAGLEYCNGDKTCGYKSLGGYRDTEYAGFPASYNRINEEGYFWTSETPGSPIDHYPLQIQHKYMGEETYYYSAFINVASWNQYGFSVRYVFEPVIR